MKVESPVRLRILQLEDSPEDAVLTLHALKRAGIEADSRRVVTRADFEAELALAPDAILSDYHLPLWDGIQALQLVRGRGLDVPFIIVSGTIGEDLAVEAMHQGADDYLLKDRLSRIGASLVQALERKRLRIVAREAAHRLEDSEAGLRRAQVMASLAHVIVAANGAFESWSESLPALIGIDSDRMPSSTRELLPHIHPEDVQGVRENSVAAGISGVRRQFEYRLWRADGGLRHIRQIAEPIEGPANPDGGLRWFNTLQDVTEQKQSAQVLRESEGRFRALFENAAAGILQSDLEGRISLVNPKFCSITGYTQDEALSLNVRDFMHPDDLQETVWRRQRLLEGALSAYELEFRLKRKPGTYLWANVVTSLVNSEDGKPVRFLSVLQDISERRDQAQKIGRLNRVHAVLSGINSLIVRATSREELFREACRIAASAGQFKLAWIGVVDREAARMTPVAWSGDRDDYDSYVHAVPKGPTSAGAAGRGLAWNAIEERRAVVSDDIAQDSRIVLKKEAAARGFQALAMLPLLVSGEAAGVLALYAGERGFFDEEEMALLVGLATDIAFAMEHLAAIARVEYLAFNDPLTGLPNRTVLIDRLDQKVAAARRERKLAGVAFFDIERFRQVNETHGRTAGDELLKVVAERFGVAIRADDTLARVGSNVFAVALGGFASAADVMRLLSARVTGAFAAPIAVAGQALTVALKAGVAVFPDDGAIAESLCANAEAALQKAKNSGERMVFYTPEINARVAESLTLENKLRHALEAEQFVLHYQPKVDTGTRKLVGLEALIRWNDPELGLVPPGKFIPLMEETGIILDAGRWALGRAVADIQAWRARGYAPPRVAVNVSQIQLRQKDFVDTVLKALEGFADAACLLDLEITESMVMQNLEPTIRALQTLRGVGVETSLDDFGTGYSSLAFAARLPVAALKIDRSFVIEMTTSKYARTIVEIVISLAHSLDLKAIAEGVDAEEQASLLVELGCDQMQGFLISKPVPAEQIEAMLSKA